LKNISKCFATYVIALSVMEDMKSRYLL